MGLSLDLFVCVQAHWLWQLRTPVELLPPKNNMNLDYHTTCSHSVYLHLCVSISLLVITKPHQHVSVKQVANYNLRDYDLKLYRCLSLPIFQLLNCRVFALDLFSKHKAILIKQISRHTWLLM